MRLSSFRDTPRTLWLGNTYKHSKIYLLEIYSCLICRVFVYLPTRNYGKHPNVCIPCPSTRYKIFLLGTSPLSVALKATAIRVKYIWKISFNPIEFVCLPCCPPGDSSSWGHIVRCLRTLEDYIFETYLNIPFKSFTSTSGATGWSLTGWSTVAAWFGEHLRPNIIYDD